MLGQAAAVVLQQQGQAPPSRWARMLTELALACFTTLLSPSRQTRNRVTRWASERSPSASRH